MKSKVELKKKVLYLRHKGKSYSEILKSVTVSRSTLSLWLRSVRLNNKQKRNLLEKQVSFRKLGSIARHSQKLEKIEKIRNQSISEIDHIKNKDLFLLGIMLYWAEGSKEKDSNKSQRVEFTNSDPRMCKLFLKWLRESINIDKDRINICIYIHNSQIHRQDEVLNYWSDITGFEKELFGRTCYTKTVYPRRKKRREYTKYYGQLRIRVSKSIDLNRKIAGWIEGICVQCGVIQQNTL